MVLTVRSAMPVYYELTYVDDDGIVHYAPIEDNYRRCLTYYRDLYREGLVDPDWYNQDMATVRQKANGRFRPSAPSSAERKPCQPRALCG